MSPVAEIFVVDLGKNRFEVVQAIDELLHCGFSDIYKRVKEAPLLVAVDSSIHARRVLENLRSLGATVGWRHEGDFDLLFT